MSEEKLLETIKEQRKQIERLLSNSVEETEKKVWIKDICQNYFMVEMGREMTEDEYGTFEVLRQDLKADDYNLYDFIKFLKFKEGKHENS